MSTYDISNLKNFRLFYLINNHPHFENQKRDVGGDSMNKYAISGVCVS